MKKLAAALLLVVSNTSHAAVCAPWEDRVGVFGAVVAESLTDPAGPYLVWVCGQIVDATGRSTTWGQWRITRHCIEGPWVTNTLSQLGGRAETIRKAANPVLAFHTALKRHVTKPSPRCVALTKAADAAMRLP